MAEPRSGQLERGGAVLQLRQLRLEPMDLRAVSPTHVCVCASASVQNPPGGAREMPNSEDFAQTALAPQPSLWELVPSGDCIRVV